MNTKISFKKYLLINAIGFGLGGLLWGWILYSELPDLGYPFHFMAIITMGLFGGISLVWFDKSIKTILKSVLAGFLGWAVGFVVIGILIYPLSLISGYFSVFLIPSFVVDNNLMILNPNIYISGYWLIFLLIGVLNGLFYSLFLKLKIWSLIWRAGIGLGLASLISPVIGNLIGNACNSLLLSYLITFCLIGIIFGLFLSWGTYLGVRASLRSPTPKKESDSF